MRNLIIIAAICTLLVACDRSPVWRLEKGQSDGVATLVHRSGGKYVGAVKNGKPHGAGTFTNAKGENFVGSFDRGMPKGMGVYTRNNGDVWKAKWNGTDIEGTFTVQKSNGDVYKIERKGENFNGTILYKKGGKYQGAFKYYKSVDLKKHGKGQEFEASGKVIRQGLWKDGEYVAKK